MNRPRNPWRQMIALFIIAVATMATVGMIASVLDPSTPEERACITKSGQSFMECVHEKWRGRK